MTLRRNGSTSGYVDIDATSVAGAGVLTLPTGVGMLAKETGSWTSWIPTWNGLTVGNGTVNAKYIQIGKTISFYLQLSFGSTSAVSGATTFSLPVTAIGTRVNVNASGMRFGIEDFPMHGYTEGSICKLWALKADVAYLTYANLSSTVPVTWATNFQIWVTGTYEAA